MSKVIAFAEFRRRKVSEHYTRAELNVLLNLYATQAGPSTWWHYKLEQRPGLVAFKLFADLLELPDFTFIKASRASHKRGRYVLYTKTKRWAQRHSLEDLLEFFHHSLPKRAKK